MSAFIVLLIKGANVTYFCESARRIFIKESAWQMAEINWNVNEKKAFMQIM